MDKKNHMVFSGREKMSLLLSEQDETVWSGQNENYDNLTFPLIMQKLLLLQVFKVRYHVKLEKRIVIPHSRIG